MLDTCIGTFSLVEYWEAGGWLVKTESSLPFIVKMSYNVGGRAINI